MREYNGFRSFHVSTQLLPSPIASAEAARRTLDPSECALIVIDIQEKLLPPIFERERVVKNSQLLIRAAGILKIPTIATTQYTKGLGEMVRDVKSLLPNDPIDKQMFSCFGSDVFCSVLKRLGVPHVSPGLPDVGMRDPGKRNTVLLCGMESHICVAQTALAALREGYLVHVASDAISSRTDWNWKVGLERMRAAGAVISSTEMIIYELLRSSGTEEFKKMLAYLK
jgi:nicotinamidase-related amidase